jgi:acyl-CoA thioester hydrolase
MTQSKKPLSVELDIPVRTYDIDFGGIVSNIVYVRWLEDLRTKMLETYLPLDALMKMDIAPVVVKTTIQYHRPVKLFDKLHAVMWMGDMGTARGTIMAEFSVGGTIVTRAEQVGAFVKISTGRPVPVPAEFVAQYNEMK